MIESQTTFSTDGAMMSTRRLYTPFTISFHTPGKRSILVNAFKDDCLVPKSFWKL
jgi:hypothetical protein